MYEYTSYDKLFPPPFLITLNIFVKMSCKRFNFRVSTIEILKFSFTFCIVRNIIFALLLIPDSFMIFHCVQFWAFLVILQRGVETGIIQPLQA